MLSGTVNAVYKDVLLVQDEALWLLSWVRKGMTEAPDSINVPLCSDWGLFMGIQSAVGDLSGWPEHCHESNADILREQVLFPYLPDMQKSPIACVFPALESWVVSPLGTVARNGDTSCSEARWRPGLGACQFLSISSSANPKPSTSGSYLALLFLLAPCHPFAVASGGWL